MPDIFKQSAVAISIAQRRAWNKIIPLRPPKSTFCRLSAVIFLLFFAPSVDEPPRRGERAGFGGWKQQKRLGLARNSFASVRSCGCKRY